MVDPLSRPFLMVLDPSTVHAISVQSSSACCAAGANRRLDVRT
jgi:hypothetical protein